jgi:hypothetical protein
VKEQFDLDDLFEPDMPQPPTGRTSAVPEKPVGEIVINPLSPAVAELMTGKPRGSGAVKGCLLPSVLVVIALAVGFGLGALVGSWRGSDSVVVDPDTEPVDGAYVAIFYNDTDLGSYSASQREFLNSVNTANYLEERKVNWKKIDTEPLEISNLEKPFQVMAEKHRSKEPWIVIASGKKFASEPIDSNDQAMKLLQKWIK